MFKQHDCHVGRGEASDAEKVIGVKALAVESPEAHPQNDAALVGQIQRECMRRADVGAAYVSGDHLVGPCGDGEQRHLQCCDVHAVLRQVGGGEEQPLDQQTGSKSKAA